MKQQLHVLFLVFLEATLRCIRCYKIIPVEGPECYLDEVLSFASEPSEVSFISEGSISSEVSVSSEASVSSKVSSEVSTVASAAVVPTVKVESKELLHQLPDDLIRKIVEENLLEDLPAIVAVNRKTRDKIDEIFQLKAKVLPRAYPLLSFAHLAVGPELAKFCVPFVDRTSLLFGRSVHPWQLFSYLRGGQWKPSPFTQQLVLIIYDFVYRNPGLSGHFYPTGDFFSFAAKVMWLQGGSAFLVHFQPNFSSEVALGNPIIFGRCILESFAMENARRAGRRVFLQRLLRRRMFAWNRELLWLFLLSFGPTCDTDIGIDTRRLTDLEFWRFVGLEMARSYDPKLGALIGCRLLPYLDATLVKYSSAAGHVLQTQTASSVNDRACTLRVKLAAVLVLIGYSAEATRLFPLQIPQGSPFHRFFLSHTEFVVLLLVRSPVRYRRSFSVPPRLLTSVSSHIIFDILDRHLLHVSSIFLALYEMYPADLTEWLDFLLRLGTPDDLVRVFNNVNTIAKERIYARGLWAGVIAYKKDLPTLAAYLQVLSCNASREQTHRLPFDSIVALLPNPPALDLTLRFFIYHPRPGLDGGDHLFVQVLLDIQRTQEFKAAPRRSKEIIRRYARVRASETCCGCVVS